jgi:hypothetical protein
MSNKEFIVTVILCITALLSACVLVFSAAYMEKKDEAAYNNGTHMNCGGHWVFKSHDNGYAYYECDKCHTILCSSKTFNQER